MVSLENLLMNAIVTAGVIHLVAVICYFIPFLVAFFPYYVHVLSWWMCMMLNKTHKRYYDNSDSLYMVFKAGILLILCIVPYDKYGPATILNLWIKKMPTGAKVASVRFFISTPRRTRNSKKIVYTQLQGSPHSLLDYSADIQGRKNSYNILH